MTEVERLRAEVERLKAELEEARAALWLAQRDVAVLGPENLRLQNAYNAALCEVARLKQPRGRGRPKKDVTGTYEEYLVRTTMEVLTEARREGRKLTEAEAARMADDRIRQSAKALHDAGIPGPFAGLATSYAPEGESILTAFRRGKRAMGMVRKRETKK